MTDGLLVDIILLCGVIIFSMGMLRIIRMFFDAGPYVQ